MAKVPERVLQAPAQRVAQPWVLVAERAREI